MRRHWQSLVTAFVLLGVCASPMLAQEMPGQDSESVQVQPQRWLVKRLTGHRGIVLEKVETSDLPMSTSPDVRFVGVELEPSLVVNRFQSLEERIRAAFRTSTGNQDTVEVRITPDEEADSVAVQEALLQATIAVWFKVAQQKQQVVTDTLPDGHIAITRAEPMPESVVAPTQSELVIPLDAGASAADPNPSNATQVIRPESSVVPTAPRRIVPKSDKSKRLFHQGSFVRRHHRSRAASHSRRPTRVVHTAKRSNRYVAQTNTPPPMTDGSVLPIEPLGQRNVGYGPTGIPTDEEPSIRPEAGTTLTPKDLLVIIGVFVAIIMALGICKSFAPLFVSSHSPLGRRLAQDEEEHRERVRSLQKFLMHAPWWPKWLWPKREPEDGYYRPYPVSNFWRNNPPQPADQGDVTQNLS